MHILEWRSLSWCLLNPAIMYLLLLLLFVPDVYFRKTGLERSEGLAKDLEWFTQHDIAIPEPSTPGVSYAKYLEDLAEKSAPLFLCHFYNIYFSHIASGQVIARQVCWLDYICVFRLLFVVISFMETKLIDLRIALPSLIFLCPDKTSLKLIYCAQLKIYGWSIICIRFSKCNNYYCSTYILQVKWALMAGYHFELRKVLAA